MLFSKQGVSYDQILAEADESGAALFVISHPGWTDLEEYMMGSVAGHVRIGAACSVLLAGPASERKNPYQSLSSR